ncbi:MAG: T9SS type A sorting domain-containing protein, partial [Cyclobacteriaceae bacterium]|nr:T9SS type A sorting domain-containing protein [Cyclobacteriaceae bacterium]
IGYAAYVRQATPITLSVSGLIAQGNSVPVPVTAQSGGGNDGWNLIGNPFPAPINWGSVTIPGGVGTQISFRDNTNNIGLGAGQYVYYTQGGAGIPASYTGTISMGQAFFVRATSNTSIVFKEADKEAVRSPQFIRKATIDNILRVHLTGAGRADELIIRLVDKAKDQSDNLFDAFKLTNDFLNFSSVSTDGVKMAINAASLFNSVNSSTERKVFPLRVEGNAVGVIAAGSYKFSFSEMETFGGDVNIILKDNLMKDSVQITGQSKELTFSVTADPKTYGDRFELIIARPSVTTSIEDAFPGNQISIYPNPTNGAVQIEVSKDFAGSVKVLNNLGQELGKIELVNSGELLKGSFDLGAQAAGFYFIRVVEGTKFYAKKVIKR